LYDGSGKLVFQGGITGSRGHVGDNNGAEAVLAFVNSKAVSVRVTPVFGCAISSSNSIQKAALP
jgi:hypothetical protein